MEFGFDPEAVGAIGSVVHNDMISGMIIVGGIAFLGFFGRLLFLSFADRAKALNPFADLSGSGLVVAAIGILVFGLFVTNQQYRALVLVKRNLVDPVIVNVLQKDSCTVSEDSACVVVFEKGREVIVNWYDHRVEMYSIINLQPTPPWHSQRPRARGTLVANQGFVQETTEG